MMGPRAVAWMLALLLCAPVLATALAGPACVRTGPDATGQWPAPSVALVPVQSDAIAALGYDAATCQMFIAFVRGKHPYTYCVVPSEVFAAFMGSNSKGEFYNSQIRKRYGCTVPLHIQ